jgi:hypothetical protein
MLADTLYRRIMKSNRVITTLTALSVAALACCTGNAAAGKQPVPISVSIWCTHDTPSTYRGEYQRAAGARPEVQTTECVDTRESIPYVRPSAVDVEYATPISSWMVAIALNEKDASRVKALIARNLGKAMLVGVNKHVLSIALLAAPMDGDKIYIRVESQQAGLELEKYLVLQ